MSKRTTHPFFTNGSNGAALLLATMALSACGSTNPELGTSPAASKNAVVAICHSTPPADRYDTGTWHDLYKLSCGPGTASEPSASRVVQPDEGGTPQASSAHSIVRTAVAQPTSTLRTSSLDTLFIYGTDEGTPIPINPDLRYKGYDFAGPEFQTLKPLVVEILAQYDNPKTPLGKLRALRDWVSRIAIHPHSPFHADLDKNTEVLPVNATWRDLDALSNGGLRWSQDSQFWGEYKLNGYKMLNRLINFDGTEPNSMLDKVGPGQYRIKKLTEDITDSEAYRTVLCTSQAYMLMALAGTIGIHGTLVSTTGHDVSAFYLPDQYTWTIIDPTYNEDYINKVTGRSVSPQEMYIASSLGTVNEQFFAAKIRGPAWAPNVYTDPNDHPAATYMGDGHPDGMTAMGSNLIQSYDLPFKTMLYQYDAPIFYNNPTNAATVGLSGRRRSPDLDGLFPKFGVSIKESRQTDANRVTIKLASNLPYHDHFEIQEGGGAWATLSEDPTLKVGYGAVKVRSVDTSGFASTVAQFELRRQ